MLFAQRACRPPYRGPWRSPVDPVAASSSRVRSSAARLGEDHAEPGEDQRIQEAQARDETGECHEAHSDPHLVIRCFLRTSSARALLGCDYRNDLDPDRDEYPEPSDPPHAGADDRAGEREESRRTRLGGHGVAHDYGEAP